MVMGVVLAVAGQLSGRGVTFWGMDGRGAGGAEKEEGRRKREERRRAVWRRWRMAGNE